jgi:3-polyprenyl-4-hydroxybenzoate decarboxylase
MIAACSASSSASPDPAIVIARVASSPLSRSERPVAGRLRLERIDMVELLPAEVQIPAAEVAAGRRLAVDRAPQLEPLDDRGRA